MKMSFRPYPAQLISLALLLPLPTLVLSANQEDLTRKIDSLSRQLEDLRQQMQDMHKQEAAKEERVTSVEQKTREVEKKTIKTAKPSALEIGGDYRFRFDSLKGTTSPYYSFQQVLPGMLGMPGAQPPQRLSSQDYRNDSLMTNRFGLNFKAKATEDVTVKARLLMYKVWGHENGEAASGFAPGSAFFADKFYAFDGNVAHIPEDNVLHVDQAYATWSNLGGAPAWMSVGRRPSTGGVPTNLRQNIDKNVADTSGVPSLLIDYAFDGATLGLAPDIQMLPGAYAKICYGKGFESGYMSANNSMKDVNFMGVNLVPYATDNLRVEMQWDRAHNIFAYPENRDASILGLPFGPNTNLGDVDQFLLGINGVVPDLGSGNLNLFLDGAVSRTHPNSNFFSVMTPNGPMPLAGLMYDAGSTRESKTGTALYLGGRYDYNPTGTKVGLEYNHGSKDWVAFAPAADDMWTAKQGVHGDVYELYLIQEINSKPISRFGKAFFRLGYQYYDFKYTGSNNWVGAPKSLSDLGDSPANAQMFPALDKSHDVYATFDVTF